MRRLLENGSNTSFVNRIVDEKLPVEKVAEDPVAKARAARPVPHPSIPLPVDLYGAERRNSAGINLASELEVKRLAERMQRRFSFEEDYGIGRTGCCGARRNQDLNGGASRVF